MGLLDRDLDRLLAASLADAQASGLDGQSAIRRAAYAVLSVRRDLTPDEAWSLAELVFAGSCSLPTG